MKGQEFRTALERIRCKLNRGELTYEEAKNEAMPIIDEMNRIGREIAAKYGKRHSNFTFAGLMR